MFKTSLSILLVLLSLPTVVNSEEAPDFSRIKNFQLVSPTLASSGSIELEDYQQIKKQGIKHVINLIPGKQDEEKQQVESLGLTYEQIPVAWDNPTLADFDKFASLLKSYDDEGVFVHCKLSWRASTFVYLYRVTQLGVPEKEARKVMEEIWQPHDGWDEYIDKVMQHYSSQ